jgi:hypothetical protein
MNKPQRKAGPILIAGMLLLYGPATPVFSVIADDARRAADLLVANQSVAGDWNEFGLEGEIIAGLENAFRRYGDASHRAAAETGGSYLLARDGFNGSQYTVALPFAAEAYALARLAQRDPATWLVPASTIFSQARSVFGSTNAYIDANIDFHLNTLGNPIHIAVYDIARQAVAAKIVDDVDRDVYRTRLMQHLADVSDDGADPSVFALGASVWALARTGPLDSTLLSGSSPVLNGRTLAELPDLLVGHQVVNPADGTPGDFYWRFDHIGAPPAGITDATTMAALGLIAAQRADPLAYDYTGRIASVIQVVANGIDTGGEAYFLVGDPQFGGGNVYAGETLEVLPEPGTITLVVIAALAMIRRRKRSAVSFQRSACGVSSLPRSALP